MEHVEYNGMVYDDIAVDMLCDLTKERCDVLDRQVNECVDNIKKLISDEKQMLCLLYNQAEAIKECTAYGATHVTKLNEKLVKESIDPGHAELKNAILKLSALCEERDNLQTMLGKCSMLCAVAEDEDGYDYGEDE